MVTIANIADRKHTEDVLLDAARALSNARSETIFEDLVIAVAKLLEVDYAVVGVCAPDSETRTINTLAVCADAQIVDNFQYALAGTPCELVFGKEFRFHESGVQEAFPTPQARALRIEGYAAFPLFGSHGEELGVFTAMARSPMKRPDLAELLLRIFAERAVAEIERKWSERERRMSEESYRALFESFEDALFIHDFDTGAIIDVNPKACEAYGYSYEEMQHVTIEQISSGSHPYTQEEAIRWGNKAKQGQPQRFEWHRKNKDGSLHWDEVVLKRAMLAGKNRIIAITREITERKQAEAQRTRLEAQLRQAQKMEAIGHLTGGIAHDFNNILTGIIGYLLMAQERAEQSQDPKLQKYLERAQRSGERARDLIQQMLTFSRGQRGEPRAIALGPLITESLMLLKSTLPSSMEIRTEFEAPLSAVLVDPLHVEQALMNLCINARDTMQGRGQVIISLRQATHTNCVCASCRQLFSGEFVELAVKDNGPGIPVEILDRMFEPFFTTKEVGKGSGMGLSSIHGIVHDYDGHVLVDTWLGAGTTMKILFRSLKEQSAPLHLALPEALEHGKSTLQGRVLVVDDDADVREFMRDLLKEWGLSVTLFGESSQACRHFAADPTHYDLVVLDQTMPKMAGLEAAKNILARRTDMPIILYTGYSEEVTEDIVKASGIRALVRKPLQVHQFYSLLEEILCSHSGLANQ